jgi:NADH-quinone oxidoreductase subunit E
MIPLPIRQAGPAESPFNPEQQRRFDAGLERAIAKYPPERKKAALLAALHLAQDELGWVSEPAMAYVASRLDVPPARVREVATFYTMYRLRPVGRHHIGVCNSISCWAMGSEKLLAQCQDMLGIHPGETTGDGQFSLEEVACLAACGNAPALLLNNFTFVEKVTEASLKDLIRELREKPGKQMAPGPLPRMPDPHAHIDKQSQPQATGALGQPAVATHPEAGSTGRNR